jgi:hypothetical protein
MTWAEFRQAVEAAGIREEDTIEVFDRKIFDELVGVYRALLDIQDEQPDLERREIAKILNWAEFAAAELCNIMDWVDMLRDRYLTGFEQSHKAIGYSGDEAMMKGAEAFRDDRDGIVKVYYTSVLATELLS